MKYQVVILAAGKGTRMDNGDSPKALSPLGDSTMIQHLLGGLHLPFKPIVVVGYQQHKIREALGDSVLYVEQTQQLGTGHAAMQARSLVDDDTDAVIVLNGDQPFADQTMIDRLIKKHDESEGPITIGTVAIDSFNDWRDGFRSYGRIVRGDDRSIQRIVEQKDATTDELEIMEVNPSVFAFNKDWLWKKLDSLENNNAQSEYYVTDVIERAFQEGCEIASINIKPLKGLGANTPDQLEVLEKVLRHEIA